MASVTQRISKIKQPFGGYLPMKLFSKEILDDGFTLNETENIHANLVGITVDYLTRFLLGDSIDKAFRISYLGASRIGMLNKAETLKTEIIGLDDQSIISACKLAGFDVCFRASKSAYKPIEYINPDKFTIENIRIMVNRSVAFLEKYGPIVCSSPTFEGGYTDTVDCGDGDFLTIDTLWDFKVSKSDPNTRHSLQILMYYIMGLHSIHKHFKNISNLGFFNPRLNIVYTCPINSISPQTITEIENNVICYGISVSPNKEQQAIEKIKFYCKDEFSVSDICNMTGLKKKAVYDDIRSGRLYAYKKGNKYCIPQKNYYDYIERKQREQKASMIFSIVIIILCLLFSFLSLIRTLG